MPADHGSNIDLISFQVLWSRLINIADEMALTLEKTAFSHVVRENHDYACAVYDSDGELIAQATTSTPGQVGAMTQFMHRILQDFGGAILKPGDVVITNDPWLGSGHTPDIYLASPVFENGYLIGFTCNCAHHADIGGRIASPEAAEVYEEGLIIPIMNLYSEGRPNDDLFRILKRNVRVSDKVIGDLHAQMASNHVGARRLRELVREHHMKTLTPVSAQILDHTETSIRSAIAELPDGKYTFKLELECTDDEGKPLVIMICIDIKGDSLHVDYSGTSKQVNRPINCVFNITFAYTMFALKCLLRPQIPNNAGCFRPITITATEGSLLNATFPSPVWWRTDVVYFVTEAIFGALQNELAERVMAGSGTYPLWLTIFAGEHVDSRQYVLHFNACGGQGARSYMDGPSTMIFPTNVSNSPIELFETDSTLICEKKALVQGSGGAGKYRGGLGQEIVLRNMVRNPVSATVSGGRYAKGAPGFGGGEPGMRGLVRVNDDEPFVRSRQIRLNCNDRLLLRMPGGGGFGNPSERDPAKVIDDVKQGFISSAEARNLYYVVMQAGSMEVDELATRKLRECKKH
jgi:N-methylhydantoinase B